MAIVECQLNCDSNTMPYEHIYAGFVRLHRQGAIKLIQSICKPDPTKVGWTGLRVSVNGTTKVYYDTFDGPDLNTQALEDVDFYFKRSLDDGANTTAKVFPLGVIYPVSSSAFDMFKMRRDLNFGTMRARVRTTVKSLITRNQPTVHDLESLPHFRLAPRVLFMTKVYDPRASLRLSRDTLEPLNSMRANCVRSLRRELGNSFFGGIAPDDFALEYCPDAVIQDSRAFTRRHYLSMLRRFPICVATKGLWNSIGFKFAEYIAHSKAIVSEPLDYRVPGNLGRNSNYLEFTTPDECVESAQRLMDDARLRQSLMLNNYRYYQLYVKPETLVLNTLAIAIGVEDRPSPHR
jgi:hypothetical protein